MINWLNNYFGFTRQQRNGFLVLAALCVLLLIARISLPHFIGEGDVIVKNLPVIEEAADTVEKVILAHKRTFDGRMQNETFAFDPNTVTQEELVRLGLSEKGARGWINYRNKGFVFRKKEDVRKVYGVSEKTYAQLEPFITIKQNTPGSAVAKQDTDQRKKTQPSIKTIDLNNADSAALTALPGIGPVFAGRIVKYRSLLGGYYSKIQLREVYGMKEDLYQKVSLMVIADSAVISKLHVNSDDFKTINRHPYISFEQTKSITSFRRKSKLTSANIGAVLGHDTVARKVLPYLDFD